MGDRNGENNAQIQMMADPDWLEASGKRDESMTVDQRKILKILAYLGLDIYLFMGRERRKIKDIHHRLRLCLLQTPTHESRNNTEEFNRIRAISRAMGDASDKMLRYAHDMFALWSYLFDLAANFEDVHTDGSEFINKLIEADGPTLSDFEGDEEAPVAEISACDLFRGSAGEIDINILLSNSCFRSTEPEQLG